jgi:hypothetical protein
MAFLKGVVYNKKRHCKEYKGIYKREETQTLEIKCPWGREGLNPRQIAQKEV